MENILVSAITALISAMIPALVTLITSSGNKKNNNMHYARMSILQLILEDHQRVDEGKIPVNYQAVLQEFDEYTANGGNSYIKGKVDEYKSWCSEFLD